MPTGTASGKGYRYHGHSIPYFTGKGQPSVYGSFFYRWLCTSFNLFKVLAGLVFQITGGFFVAEYDSILVELEDRKGAGVAYSAFDGIAEDTGFVFARGDDEDFPGIHDGSYADGEGYGGHLGAVSAKKTSVGVSGIHRKGFDPGSGT
jgi:hypothetical protein